MNLQKIVLFYRLLRLNSPTGFLLCFFPAAYGAIMANPWQVNYQLISFFFIGSIFTRSAGCIINDILDKDFDKNIARTKNRPLAAKALTIKEAVIVLILLLLTSLIILLSLNKIAIFIGFIGFILICIYPLMKRITFFPQLFLGITFNIGALIGYAAVCGQLTMQAWLLYLSTTFWIIGYDTIYAFMDLVDDKKTGVKSLARKLADKIYKQYLLAFYTIFITLFIYANIYYYPISSSKFYLIYYPVIAYFLLFIQIITLDINSVHNCLNNFKINNYVGMILILYLLRL